LNNPLRYTDPDGEAPRDAVVGFFNGFHASYTLGLTRGTGNSDYRLGQQAGAKVAQRFGLIEMALVGLSIGGGGAACAGTGIGCALVPATTAGGLALAGHGATVAGTAQVVFNQAAEETSSGGPTFEASPKHGTTDKGGASNGPKDGQAALDASVQVKDTSPRRVGVDRKNGEIVVLDQTSAGKFHGHVRKWDQLTDQQRNARIKGGYTDKRGRVLPEPE
jgi:hypothetical protein